MNNKPPFTYQLRHLTDDRWEIVGELEDTVFTGTLADCEAWLDGEERLQNLLLPKQNLAAQAAAWLHQVYARPAVHSSTKKG